MKWIVVLFVGLSVGACDGRSAAIADDEDSSFAATPPVAGTDDDRGASLTTSGAYEGTGYGGYAYGDDEEFDEDRARDAAEDELASDTYVGASMAYGCTEDCSGHEAGWSYQGQSGYGSPYSGRSESFQEGRQAFDEAVDDRVEEMRHEFEDAQEDGDDYGY